MSEKAEIIALGLKDPEEADHVLSKLYMLPREYLAGEEGVVFLEPLVASLWAALSVPVPVPSQVS